MLQKFPENNDENYDFARFKKTFTYRKEYNS